MKTSICLVILLLFFQISASAVYSKYYDARGKILSYINKLPGVQGVGFKDFESGETFYVSKKRYVPAASIIKMPVMAAVYMEAADGKLNLNERLILNSSYILGGSGILKRSRLGNSYSIRELVTYMIANSDNTATYMLIRRMGISTVQKRIRELGMYNTTLKDQTMLAEEAGRWMNLTTPEDIIKLLSLIYKGKVANRTCCQEMLGVMKQQHYRWGIPRKLPDNLVVANKTGFQEGVLNDVGIVYTSKGDYAIAVFVSGIPNMYTERSIINKISLIAYKGFMGMSKRKKVRYNATKSKRKTYRARVTR